MKQTGPFYLGIDIGTGSVKVMLIDDKGISLGSAASEYPTSYPKPGYVEQNPEDWYRQTCVAVRRLLEQENIDRSKIIGIGICGTAHAPILLDGNTRVLRPAILWSDQRSHREVLELKTEGEEEIQTLTWNGIDCTWTLPQLLWIKRNEPDTFRKIHHLMISKDYIVYRFTRRITSDFSSVVSSLLVDANTLNWNIRLVQRAGLRLEMLSEILSPSDMAGKLTSTAAHDLGLSPGICVARGFLDSAAELIGVGALNETIGVIRLGSAGGVMVINRNGRYRKNCLAYPHPVKPFWYYQAGTNACTTSLLWVRDLFSSSSKRLSYTRIDSLSQSVSPGCNGLLFHPYLLGERVLGSEDTSYPRLYAAHWANSSLY